MGTKQNPGANDCYEKALPDEPMFTLLARDPQAANIVRRWSNVRLLRITNGHAPMSDMALVQEASELADEMEAWRVANYGKWWR